MNVSPITLIFLLFFIKINTFAQPTKAGLLTACDYSIKTDTIIVNLKIKSLADTCFFFTLSNRAACYLLLQAELRSKKKKTKTYLYFPCPGLYQLDKIIITNENAIRLKRNETHLMQLRFAKAGFAGLPENWQKIEMRIKINYANLDDDRVTRENLSTDWFPIKRQRRN